MSSDVDKTRIGGQEVVTLLDATRINDFINDLLDFSTPAFRRV